ncbi:MAG: DUF4347 domain-containing protein, partial [Cyanobacteria bacterium J06621_15]
MMNTQKNFRSIAFIDSGLEAQEQLVSGIFEGIEIVQLEPHRDGIVQITEVLTQYSGQFTTVHIVSHGKPGCLYLGNTQLNLDNFSKYADQLKDWFAAIDNVSSDLFIYGCQVAAGDAGAEFIAKLHDLTKANIAASANLTGNAALGGDWELEVTLGEGNFSSAFTQETISDYAFVFNSSPIFKEEEFESEIKSAGVSDTSKEVLLSIFRSFEKKESDPQNTPTALIKVEDSELEVTYLGINLSLDALVPDVDGFALKDFTDAAKLDLGSISISSIPTIVIKNYKNANEAEYEILLKDFSLAEFINQVTAASGVTVNSNLQKSLKDLGKFDLSLT